MSPTAIDQDQKRRELIQFETFRAACERVPQCEIDQPRAPEPDVVLMCPDGLVGVELTEIHPSGEEKRPSEGERGIVTALAKCRYEETGLPPVHVSIQGGVAHHG